MEEVRREEFDRAVREYARFALPNSVKGEVWTYYGSGDARIGMLCGRKYWLEEEILKQMSTSDGQKEV